MPDNFRIATLTPGLLQTSIAVAAHRAGELGILDFEYVGDPGAVVEAVQQFDRLLRAPFGVKLDGDRAEALARVVDQLPEQVRTVILTSADPHQLEAVIGALRGKGVFVLLEARCLEHAKCGEKLGVDGLVAKGHEAGGRVAEETTFILLQRLQAEVRLPLWAHGGIGLHTAAACVVAGATGLVLDVQLALTRESPLAESLKARIANMDGSETVCLGDQLGETYRIYSRPGNPVVKELQQAELRLAGDECGRETARAEWRRAIAKRAGWESEQNALLLGQDSAFAAPLAERFLTVGGVLQAIRQAVRTRCESAANLRPLDEGSPLARANGTRYPILQGPMTRVSDVPEFAARVSEAGALPFLALALMRGPEVRAVLAEAQQRMGKQPWGVGILGFVPAELRQEQMDVITEYRPPFALIAGGRPDQARMLEQQGISTYLHVPSPGLLRMFVQQGARRFVFEGRECGGHVGPRTSFVLWNQMVEVLLHAPELGTKAEEFHVVFAGGIHDALSAAMVSVIAAPLAERGVRIGVLLGTAYLFTKEAVESGAILETFQEQARKCRDTVLLETGPGHSTRCVNTAFATTFSNEKRRMLTAGHTADDVRNALEELNLGRLRIASKGVTRHPKFGQDPTAPKLMEIEKSEQVAEGMYMIGQVAALRNTVCTAAALHYEVAVEGTKRIQGLADRSSDAPSPVVVKAPSDVAIIGMACILPKAPDLGTYWENILHKVNAVGEVPKDRWDWQLYFDSDPKAKDKIYSRWGGFVEDVPFDPMQYGMPPSSLRSIEPSQLLTLEVVRAALADAGYVNRPFARDRTSVILGAGGGAADLGLGYGARSFMPMLEELPEFRGRSQEIIEKLDGRLPEWTEDSFAGILTNVAAGRVANRFDLGGSNYTVDAACASSLAAVSLALKELEGRTSDMVIVGGVDTMQNPFTYLCFSKTHALSPRGRCRTFDETADGIAISEGVAMMVFKRLEDAERDGDRIYAVIRGAGSSSDGKDRGLTAPRPEGQARALERAYAKAGISPATVGLIEAHGTGTVAGDGAEVQALTEVFSAAQAPRQGCAIGSVKSMIGHTKCTAGAAGLVKAALALYHRVLPPTLGVDNPNPRARFPETPFFVNTEARPWLEGSNGHPRRAGVSAFGFGGTNFHIVLEEYTGDPFSPRPAPCREWSDELFVWTADSRQALLSAVESWDKALAAEVKPTLRDLAYTAWKQVEAKGSGLQLAIVASTLDDLRQKLASARQSLLQNDTARISDPRGIYFSAEPLAGQGKVAFLFPGQGSQYPGMLQDVLLHFPELQPVFERASRVLENKLEQPLGAYVFPPPAFSKEEAQKQKRALTETNVAQPALGAVSMVMFGLLQELGLQPDMLAGHSYGEYVALAAAGTFNEETLIAASEARGRFIVEGAGAEPGIMAAIEAESESVTAVLKNFEGVCLANANAPKQSVISGPKAAVERAVAAFESQGIAARIIPVACAFHSPLVAPAQERLAQFLSAVKIEEPQVTVFSNTTAAPYPKEPHAIANRLVEHLVQPVEFVREVESMYDAGARIFVEVGPRSVLTNLVDQILGDRPKLAVASNQNGRPGVTQLLHLLGQLAAQGCALKLNRLYRDRATKRLDLNALKRDCSEKPLPPSVWMVNGARALPLKEISGGSNQRAAVTRPAPVSQNSMTKSSDPLMKSPASATPAPMTTSLAVAAPVIPRLDSTLTSAPSPQVAPATIDPPAPLADMPANPMTALPVALDAAHQVMAQFQQMMTRFLDTQKTIMLAYLGADSGAAAPAAYTVAPTGVSAPLPFQVPAYTAPTVEPVSTPLPAQPVSVAVTVPVATAPQPPQPVTVTVAVATAPAQEEPVAARGPDRKELTAQLLSIVSERTGYPPEMLDLNLDLEADLGIDSIKRVEILGTFQQSFASAGISLEEGLMEKLSGVRTLQGILDRIMEQAEVPPEPPPSGKPDSTPVSMVVDYTPAAVSQNGVGDEQRIGRFTLSAVETPLKTQSRGPAKDRVILITDCGHAAGTALVKELRGQGYTIAVARQERSVQEFGPGSYGVDFNSPQSVADLLTLVGQRQGPLGGIVHLLALQGQSSFTAHDFQSWREQLRLGVKSLFHVVKAAGKHLREAGAANGASLIAATSMGGTFLSALPAHATAKFPDHGAIAGLMKTVALEWPEVRVKVVDLNADDSGSALARHLSDELHASDEHAEVGYDGQRRITLQPNYAPLPAKGPAAFTLDPSSVILITGGARGITARAAKRLAELYQPTLVLAGRSSLPPLEESAETAGITAPRELKAALMEQMRRRGETVMPALVERAYAHLLAEREVRSNLNGLRELGSQVHYYPVDVRNAEAFGALVDGIYTSFGRLDGVIHGAGVIEDKLLQDKTPESFDRVFDTKVDSAFVLSRRLRPESLKFLLLFSSVSGRFGNRGQGDYAAANDVLNKLAICLDRTWPGRVVAMNWGPWDTEGMVSAEVRRQFAERGVELIAPATGLRRLMEELLYGHRGDAEVVIGGVGWQAPAQHASPNSWPLLQQTGLSQQGGDVVEVIREIDPDYDIFLNDHRLDGQPVLPLAIATELIAEAVAKGWPGMHVAAVRDLRLLHGVVIENGSKRLGLVAKMKEGTATRPTILAVEVSGGTSPQRVHYRADVELAERLPDAPPLQVAPLSDGRPFSMSVPELYHKWLFHGPVFQGITQVDLVGVSGIRARLATSTPEGWFAGPVAGPWLIDPLVFDSALQLLVLWSREHWDMTALPSGFQSYRRFAAPAPARILCELRLRPNTGGQTIHADIFFADADTGAVVGILEDMQGACSKALNRLAGDGVMVAAGNQ